MEKLNKIDDSTRLLQLLLVVATLMGVSIVSFYSEGYIQFILGFIAVFAFSYLGNQWIMRWRDKSILSVYAALKTPIFEVQFDKADKWVWQRAEIHRQYLKRSRNELYESKKIDVIEIYMNDPAIRFTEAEEEYWLRVEDFKRDYLDTWAKKVAPQDENWRKIHLHNQDMTTPKLRVA